MWAYLFAALFLAALVYVALRGGWEERATMAAFVAASIATNIDIRVVRDNWIGTRWGEFWIDVVLLAVLVAIALRSKKGWLQWMIALQSIATLGHLSRALQPDVMNMIYYSLTAMLAYPMLALLIAATWRHRRAAASATKS